MNGLEMHETVLEVARLLGVSHLADGLERKPITGALRNVLKQVRDLTAERDTYAAAMTACRAEVDAWLTQQETKLDELIAELGDNWDENPKAQNLGGYTSAYRNVLGALDRHAANLGVTNEPVPRAVT